MSTSKNTWALAEAKEYIYKLTDVQYMYICHTVSKTYFQRKFRKIAATII